MGVCHTFGEAGCATGMADDEVIFRCNVDIRQFCRLRRQPVLIGSITNEGMLNRGYLIADIHHLMIVRIACHQHFAVRMGQHMNMGFTTVTRIQGYPDQIGNSSTVKKISSFNRIVFDHTDPVARLQAH